MSLSAAQKSEIEEVLKESLRTKFKTYSPEPASMPFHTRLLGKDRLALYSFIHSLNTNFGTTIFEPIGLILGKKNFKTADHHVNVGNKISSEAQSVIQKIIDSLTTATSTPDKKKEIEIIRNVCQKGEMIDVRLTLVDLKVISESGKIFLFDIKTAKPNAGGFREFKRTLLEWVAAVLALDPNADVGTLIAIPYNPYEPAPYSRWTMRGMLDLGNELKVAEEFWDFLGGEGTYTDLLDCFENVGISLRAEIDTYFSKFK